MGVDIHVRIVKFNNKEGKYEEVKLYRKANDEMELIDFYPGRNSELFSYLAGEEDSSFPSRPICFHNLPLDLVHEIEECNSFGYYGFQEVNLADAKLYLYRRPLVEDWDSEDENALKDNPVKDFIHIIENALDLYDPWWDWHSCLSDVRVIYWFDR